MGLEARQLQLYVIHNALGDHEPSWGLRQRHGKTRLCIGDEKESAHICLLSWTNVFRAGCNTLVWETVDGQKIVPLRKCFCFEMLYQCFAILAFQIGHPEERPPLPPFSMLWSRLGGAVCVWFASCLSRVFLSHEHPPILNLEGSGRLGISF